MNDQLRPMFFFSRHQATDQQKELALQKGFKLIDAGDIDGFSVDLNEVVARMQELVAPATIPLYSRIAVGVVNPAVGLSLAPYFEVGVFQPAARPEVGAAPSVNPGFTDLLVWNLIDSKACTRLDARWHPIVFGKDATFG